MHDSFELAWSDWQGSAGFDRLDDQDAWRGGGPSAYVEFAAGRNGHGCTATASGSFPTVGWAERGDLTAHRTRQLRPPLPHHLGHRHRSRRAVRASSAAPPPPGWSGFYLRHRVDELIVTGGTATGVRGSVLRPRRSPRGVRPTATRSASSS